MPHSEGQFGAPEPLRASLPPIPEVSKNEGAAEIELGTVQENRLRDAMWDVYSCRFAKRSDEQARFQTAKKTFQDMGDDVIPWVVNEVEEGNASGQAVFLLQELGSESGLRALETQLLANDALVHEETSYSWGAVEELCQLERPTTAALLVEATKRWLHYAAEQIATQGVQAAMAQSEVRNRLKMVGSALEGLQLFHDRAVIELAQGIHGEYMKIRIVVAEWLAADATSTVRMQELVPTIIPYYTGFPELQRGEEDELRHLTSGLRSSDILDESHPIRRFRDAVIPYVYHRVIRGGMTSA